MLAKGIYSKIYFFLYPFFQCRASRLPQQNCLAQKQSFWFSFLSQRDWQLVGLFSKAFRCVIELPICRSLYVSQHHSSKYYTLLGIARPPGEKITDFSS